MTQWGLDTLFNPAKRHMDEEKRRLQSTREQIGDNSGGRRIDLESGKVTIRRAEDEDEGGDEAADAEPDTRRGRRKGASATEAAKKDTAKKDTAKKDTAEPSAAAIRAAERRKRRPS